MIICDLCNKEFKYKSELEKHKNKKKPCGDIIMKYNCNLCNSNFNFKSLLDRHLNTPMHKKNYNVYIETNKVEDINNLDNNIESNKITELRKQLKIKDNIINSIKLLIKE